jgi:hypothetical protein
MDKFWTTITDISLAVVGLAILSILVSKNSNTTGVVQSLFSGFGNALATAEAPVTGASAAPILSYPSSGSPLH